MQGIRRFLSVKCARGGIAATVGLSAAFAGVTLPAPTSLTASKRPSPDVVAAEAVARPFVVGFESFGSDAAARPEQLRALATPELAAQLDRPSDGGSGDADQDAGLAVTATVDRFDVVSSAGGVVQLLATTTLHVRTSTDSATTPRLVPVRVVSTSAGWRVADIDGLSSTPPAPPADPGPAAADAGGGTPASPAPGTPDGGMPAAPPASPARPATAGSAAAAVADIPADYVAWFQGAAATCPGLPWSVLAGIGKVESDFGRSRLPGVTSGSNSAGAQGPMQFLPATFKAYAVVGPGGADPASPYDGVDAVYSAAHYLCANGAGDPARLYSAIFRYNHSAAYVSLVLAYSAKYAAAASAGLLDPSGAAADTGLGSVIVAYARTFLGTPYVWGGESPGGFDCSGLVQWVYAKAGLSLPRVAQDQYNAGPRVAAGGPLYPGDLVFFGSTTHTIHHVGIYIGDGQMIDAPHTGAVVRVDRVAAFGDYIGATRPEVPDLATGTQIPVFVPSAGATSRPHDHAPRPPKPPAAPTPTDAQELAAGPADSHGRHRSHPAPPPGTGGPADTSSTTAPGNDGSGPGGYRDGSGAGGYRDGSGRHRPTPSTTAVPPATDQPPATVSPAASGPAASSVPTGPRRDGRPRPDQPAPSTTSTTSTTATFPARSTTATKPFAAAEPAPVPATGSPAGQPRTSARRPAPTTTTTAPPARAGATGKRQGGRDTPRTRTRSR